VLSLARGLRSSIRRGPFAEWTQFFNHRQIILQIAARRQHPGSACAASSWTSCASFPLVPGSFPTAGLTAEADPQGPSEVPPACATSFVMQASSTDNPKPRKPRPSRARVSLRIPTRCEVFTDSTVPLLAGLTHNHRMVSCSPSTCPPCIFIRLCLLALYWLHAAVLLVNRRLTQTALLVDEGG
jgi:hypothetical protein